MKREDVLAKLEEIFADLLDVQDFQLTENASTDTVDEWDSLLHITLMASAEAEFGIHFSTEEIEKAKNVRALTDIILLELDKK